MALVTIDAAKTYGIASDGNDYTEELQAALNKASKVVEKDHDPCQVHLPPGPISHSATLMVRGTQGGAPFIVGSGGDGFDLEGTRLVWKGAQDGLQLFLECFNRGRIWDVAFDGQDKAGRNLHVSASKFGDPTQLRATSGYSIQRCKFSRVRPGVDGNGCVALGTDPTLTGGQTFQSSEWSIRDCIFMPESNGAPGFSYAGMKAFGFRTLSPGNCKNGEILNCDFITCNKAIDWKDSSGYLNVQSVRMADVRFGFLSNSGHLRATSGAIECGHVDDFRLLWGTMQIGAFATLEDIYCDWETASGVNPVLWEYAGALALRRNQFRCGDYRPFRMVHGGPASSNSGSFVSEQNWYAGCGLDRPFIPLLDGSGNDLAPLPNTYAGVNWLNLKSWGDMGGTTGNRIRLRAHDWTKQGTPP